MHRRGLAVPLLTALCAALALAGCARTGSLATSDRPDGPGTGVLLVGNKSAASVWRLGLADGRRLGEVATGQGPHEIAVAADRRIAVVADYGSGDAPGNTLTVLDIEGGTTRTVSLGANTRPHGLRFLPGGRRLVATTEGSDALVVVDLDAGEVVRAIAIGPGKGHMVALSADGRAHTSPRSAAASWSAWTSPLRSRRTTLRTRPAQCAKYRPVPGRRASTWRPTARSG
ncbi:MAG TPA: hypothetical protein VIG97_01780 [Luteimonas sp.]